MFIAEDDYKVVIGDIAMKVVSQASAENRANAEREHRRKFRAICVQSTIVMRCLLRKAKSATIRL